jgi:polyisoprenoid-binding protein YceI
MSTTKWALDPTHSELQFKVKHLMITTVTGNFKSFTASVETEGDNFDTAKIDFSAEVSSIESGNEQRDGHLKSVEFFEEEKFPTITFTSTKLEKINEENYMLHGDLTIKGISIPVSIPTEFGGIAKDPWGNIKAGFTLNGKISRKDWDLNWNAALETGGVLVSDEVKIIAEIQVVKQA